MGRTRLMPIMMAASLLIPHVSRARVAPVTLKKLVEVADFIVIGRVVRVSEVDGVRTATLEISEAIKGNPPGKRLEFLAQPTWLCDGSRAVLNESGLFFLNKPRGDAHPILKLPAAQGMLLRITWAGRGQMPARWVNGEEYVNLWTDDVHPVDGLETIIEPQGEYFRPNRLVRLQDLVRVVRTFLSERKLRTQ